MLEAFRDFFNFIFRRKKHIEEQKRFLTDQRTLLKEALILYTKCFPQEFLDKKEKGCTDEEFLAALEKGQKELMKPSALLLYLNFQRQMNKFNQSKFSQDLNKLFSTAKNRNKKSFQTLQSLLITPVQRPIKIAGTMQGWLNALEKNKENLNQEEEGREGVIIRVKKVIERFTQFNTHINKMVKTSEFSPKTSLLKTGPQDDQGEQLKKLLQQYKVRLKKLIEDKSGPLEELQRLSFQVSKTLAIVKLKRPLETTVQLSTLKDQLIEIFECIKRIELTEKLSKSLLKDLSQFKKDLSSTSFSPVLKETQEEMRTLSFQQEQVSRENVFPESGSESSRSMKGRRPLFDQVLEQLKEKQKEKKTEQTKQKNTRKR